MKPFGKSRGLFSFLARSLIFSLLIFCATDLNFAIAGFQAPDFYYYHNEKIYLPLSTEILIICFEDDVTKEQREAIVRDDPVLERITDENLPSGLVMVKVVEGLDKTDIVEAIERLNTLQQVRYSSPIFQYRDMKIVLMDRFIVRFKADISESDIRALNQENGVEIVSKSPYRHNRYVLRVGNAKVKNVIAVANLYNENPKIKYAAPDFLVIGAYCNTPNDTYFSSQWGLNNTGQNPPGGTEDADIDAPEGWDITTGSSDIVIAIIDRGVDIGHEDLAAKIWVNEDEQIGDGNGDGRPGIANVDDDGDGLIDEDSAGRQPGELGYTNDLVNDDDENGYMDDFHGWDFVNNDNDPRPPAIDEAHGTACAGLAAAQSNNGKGIAGVCWGAQIMPLMASYSSSLWISAKAEAIDYAWANGADVLSNSWITPPHPDITDAIIQAKNYGRDGKGCVIVACTGNDGYDAIWYPSSLSETIAVGAVDNKGVRWDYSNYGDGLDVVAPSTSGQTSGVFFWTTDINGIQAGYNNPNNMPDRGDDAGNYYKWFSGTSAAAPQVAGFAGLILSVDNTLTSEEVRWLMRNSADDLGDVGWDKYYGAGRINVYNALHGMSNIPGKATNPFPDEGATGFSVNVDLSWKAATGALSHNVYFGTDYDSVENANTSSDEFKGNQLENILQQDALQPNTTYYWRIDEKNKQGVTAGDVWHFTTGASSGIYYVVKSAAPGGNGSSWANAFNDLQDALGKAWSGDEIWVAEGTYKPTDGSVRSISFELVKGVGIYGGFAGTETSRDQRNWSSHQTILSGDIGTIDDASDNSYHVVKGAASNAVLDGFTITKGNANGSGDDGRGGGMFIGVTLAVNHCTFKNNNAKYGGGMYICFGSPILKNSIFTGNTTTNLGGGIYNYWSAPIVENCTFSKNTAYYYGGGMYNNMSYSIVTNCILWDDAATLPGSEIYNLFWSNPTFRYCDIKGGLNHSPGCSGDPSTDGGGNIESDPLFVAPNNDDFHLGAHSLCINAGDPDGDYNGQKDIDSDPRKMSGRVDMGADEVECLIGGVAHANEHADWVAWSRPDCWCYARQCRGDINGKKTLVYWVQLLDLQLLSTAYNKTDAELALVPGGICSDVNHKKTLVYRVQLLDLQELTNYYNKPEEQVPVCDQEPITTGPYNFWTQPPP